MSSTGNPFLFFPVIRAEAIAGMITKKMVRVWFQHHLRNSYLLATAEQLRYHFIRLWLYNRNNRFRKENPGFVLPPSYLAFDAYSTNHWEFYKVSGEITARFLQDIIKKYFPANRPPDSVFEWGCGPARIIRQLPALLGTGIEYHAADYNATTIDWCKKNIPGINFHRNELTPPLPYADEQFDFVYAISVFTHLSEATGLAWADELLRVLKPGGLLLITTNSNRAYEKELLPAEKRGYDSAGIVVRDKYKEGKKMFLAMHSPRYIKEKLLQQFLIEEHVPSSFPFMKQDYWIARKRFL